MTLDDLEQYPHAIGPMVLSDFYTHLGMLNFESSEKIDNHNYEKNLITRHCLLDVCYSCENWVGIRLIIHDIKYINAVGVTNYYIMFRTLEEAVLFRLKNGYSLCNTTEILS